MRVRTNAVVAAIYACISYIHLFVFFFICSSGSSEHSSGTYSRWQIISTRWLPLTGHSSSTGWTALHAELTTSLVSEGIHTGWKRYNVQDVLEILYYMHDHYRRRRFVCVPINKWMNEWRGLDQRLSDDQATESGASARYSTRIKLHILYWSFRNPRSSRSPFNLVSCLA